MIDGFNEVLSGMQRDPAIDVAAGDLVMRAETAASDFATRFGDVDAPAARQALVDLAGVFERSDIVALGRTPRPARGCSCVVSQGFKLHGYDPGDLDPPSK